MVVRHNRPLMSLQIYPGYSGRIFLQNSEGVLQQYVSLIDAFLLIFHDLLTSPLTPCHVFNNCVY